MPVTIRLALRWRHMGVKLPRARLLLQRFVSGLQQVKHQASSFLALCDGIHWWPVDSIYKGPVWEVFPGCHELLLHTMHPKENKHVSHFIVFCCIWLLFITWAIITGFLWSVKQPLRIHGISSHGPLTRYVKLRVAHAPGMPGTFCPPPWISDPDMHHGTSVTYVPWCIPGSLTSGFLWSRWRKKHSQHSRCMRNA